FRPEYVGPAEQRERAERALASLRRASPPSEGGWGWNSTIGSNSNLAYLSMVVGRLDEAEAYQARVVDLEVAQRGRPEAVDVGTLADLMMRRGAVPEAMLARVRAIIAASKT